MLTWDERRKTLLRWAPWIEVIGRWVLVAVVFSLTLWLVLS
jgi:hypothetical protein